MTVGCLLHARIACAQATAKSENNGTDPTSLTTSAGAQYEYLDLPGGLSRDTLNLDFAVPFGASKDYSLRLRVPLVQTDVFNQDGYGLGDVSLQGTHVFGLTKTHGLVVQAELLTDTAGRDELGSGRTVFKGAFIYARFLASGIFAPAIVQSQSIGSGSGSGRADVRSTTFDLYYVPKLADPKNFMTIDPAMTFDWQRDKRFPSLAVTFGRVLGRVWNGSSQLFVKPTLFVGGDRPSQWGIQVGYKVIGF